MDTRLRRYDINGINLQDEPRMHFFHFALIFSKQELSWTSAAFGESAFQQ